MVHQADLCIRQPQKYVIKCISKHTSSFQLEAAKKLFGSTKQSILKFTFEILQFYNNLILFAANDIVNFSVGY
jgi:hypothetical protein